MARTVLTVRKLTEMNSFSDDITNLTQAVDATEGAEFTMKRHDERTLIIVQNAATADKDVTILAGNSQLHGANLVKKVPASSYTAISIDSGRFKNISGDDKGKVIIKGESADIKVAVFMLP